MENKKGARVCIFLHISISQSYYLCYLNPHVERLSGRPLLPRPICNIARIFADDQVCIFRQRPSCQCIVVVVVAYGQQAGIIFSLASPNSNNTGISSFRLVVRHFEIRTRSRGGMLANQNTNVRFQNTTQRNNKKKSVVKLSWMSNANECGVAQENSHKHQTARAPKSSEKGQQVRENCF